MPFINEDGLYPALESVLKTKKEPMDCHQLFDIPKIRNLAASANRVSDYLGNMWRKGQLIRLPADGGSRARWLYKWKEDQVPRPPGRASETRQVIANRPALTISEVGKEITIELADLIIVIKPKA